MEEMFANSVNEELTILTSLKHDDGFMVLKKIIRWRQGKLIKDLLVHMRNNKLIEAQDARARYDEIGKLPGLVEDRIKALQTESNKEG